MKVLSYNQFAFTFLMGADDEDEEDQDDEYGQEGLDEEEAMMMQA